MEVLIFEIGSPVAIPGAPLLRYHFALTISLSRELIRLSADAPPSSWDGNGYHVLHDPILGIIVQCYNLFVMLELPYSVPSASFLKRSFVSSSEISGLVYC